jgi:hypothetical protein
MPSQDQTITAGMVNREELALKIEKELGPLLKVPGGVNALGMYMLVMKIVKGEK